MKTVMVENWKVGSKSVFVVIINGELLRKSNGMNSAIKTPVYFKSEESAYKAGTLK